MSNNDNFVEFVKTAIENFAQITSKKMFGGYGLYFENKIFAIIANNCLYFKVNSDTKEIFQKIPSYPFTYDGKGKIIEMSYFLISDDIIEDDSKLKYYFNLAVQASNSSKKFQKTKNIDIDLI